MSAEQQQLVKIHWNNELRLLPCNLNNFQELVQQCAARFEIPAGNLVLSYQDECSDTITVATDADLQAALACFSQSKVRPKFSLIKKENPTAPLPVVGGPKFPIPFHHPKMIHPCFAARRHLACRGPQPSTPATPAAPAAPAVSVPAPQPPKVQPPKTEAEKKAEKRQKKQALRLQKLAGLKATRIVRLRWKEPTEVEIASSSSSEGGQEGETKKVIKDFKGCYFGVQWKNRGLTFECGRGLRSLWFLRQLKDGDVVLSSMVCPNRFLRMNKSGVLEFNTGENGPWARWNVLNSETGEKLNNVDGKLLETLVNGSKIHLASKAVVGKFLGQKKNEKKKEEMETEQWMATGVPEGLIFTVEVVEALKAPQIIKLCCDGVTLIDPKTEDKEKKEKKAKKLEEEKKKKDNNNKANNNTPQTEEKKKTPPKITNAPAIKKN